MDYSDRQTKILRERLSAFYLNEAPSGKKGVPWHEVSERIERLTGVRIPEESLRQFANPSNKKQGKKPRTPSDNERLEAICDFLSHDDVGYLSKYELDDKPALFKTAYSLTEFLDNPQSSSTQSFPPKLTGTFRSFRHTDTAHQVIELRIDQEENGSLIKVNEVDSFEDCISEEGDTFDRILCSGWAVFQKSGMLLMFLTDPLTYKSHCYFTLVASPSLQPDIEVSSLILCKYIRPLDIELESMSRNDADDTVIIDLAKDLVEENIFIFQRRA